MSKKRTLIIHYLDFMLPEGKIELLDGYYIEPFGDNTVVIRNKYDEIHNIINNVKCAGIVENDS
jgi:hypothetical protein